MPQYNSVTALQMSIFIPLIPRENCKIISYQTDFTKVWNYFFLFQEYFFKSQESLATVIDNEEEDEENEDDTDERKSQDSQPDHPKAGQKDSENAEKVETKNDNTANLEENEENMKTASLKTTNVWEQTKLSYKQK